MHRDRPWRTGRRLGGHIANSRSGWNDFTCVHSCVQTPAVVHKESVCAVCKNDSRVGKWKTCAHKASHPNKHTCNSVSTERRLQLGMGKKASCTLWTQKHSLIKMKNLIKHILGSLSFENATQLLPGVWFLRFPSLPPPPIYAPNQSSPFGRFPCWPLQGMREEGDCLLEGLLSSFYLAHFKIKRHSLFVLKEQLKITGLFDSHYLLNVLYQNTFSTISQGSYFSLQICQSCPCYALPPLLRHLADYLLRWQELFFKEGMYIFRISRVLCWHSPYEFLWI